jgi:hypothetical protein
MTFLEPWLCLRDGYSVIKRSFNIKSAFYILGLYPRHSFQAWE